MVRMPTVLGCFYTPGWCGGSRHCPLPSCRPPASSQQEAKIDPQSLIIVCDKHGFVDELTKYLYENNMHKAIEGYVTAYNPKNTPIVVGTLLDLDCNEDFIRSLLNAVRSQVCCDTATSPCAYPRRKWLMMHNSDEITLD